MNRLLTAVSVLAVLVVAQSLAAAYPQAYRWERVIGGPGNSLGQFAQPAGLYVRGNKLYVADSNNQRVQILSLTGTPIAAVGGSPTLQVPMDVTVDPAGNIYIVDASLQQLVKYNADRTFNSTVGTLGSTPGKLNWPLGIGWDPLNSRVGVVERFNNRLSLFSSALAFLSTRKPSGARALNEPGGLVYDPSGNYYIVDTGNARLEYYNAAGVYQRTVTAGLFFPYRAALAPDGNLVIADTLHSRIVKTTPTGTVLAVFGSFGPGTYELSYPYGVAVDASGFVYIADNNKHRIVRLRPDRKPTAPTTVRINPAAPDGSDNLAINASGSTDPDGDAVTYEYRWYRKANAGAPWTLYDFRKRVLTADRTAPGQRWKASARAFDGDIYSAWVEASAVTIAAAAPTTVTATAARTAAGAALTVNLRAAAEVEVDIFNLAGRTVALLSPRQLPAGVSTLLWNGRSTTGTLAPSGRYLVRVIAKSPDGSSSTATAGLDR